MSNPFDWHGPAFLGFYVLAGIVTLWLLRQIRRWNEGDRAPTLPITDAYMLACLRGGPDELVTVALASLFDRGLLLHDDNGMVLASDDRSDCARKPVEMAIAEAGPATVEAIRKDPSVVAATEPYHRQLLQLGLLVSAEQLSTRRNWRLIAATMLVVVAAIKIGIAFSRGRHNVGFLVLLAIVFVFLVLRSGRSHRTVSGDDLLADVRHLFAGLRSRTIAPGGATQDLALKAAVFGLATIPVAVLPSRDLLMPPALAMAGGSADSGSGSSSSCSSSCGGSSCGGGGCGGCGS